MKRVSLHLTIIAVMTRGKRGKVLMTGNEEGPPALFRSRYGCDQSILNPYLPLESECCLIWQKRCVSLGSSACLVELEGRPGSRGEGVAKRRWKQGFRQKTRTVERGTGR